MREDENVLCSASQYKQKYYFNKRFDRLPESIKQELQIMCVLFTEDVGGILTLRYDEDGSLELRTQAYEEDILYDEIGSVNFLSFGRAEESIMRLESHEIAGQLTDTVIQ